MNNELYHWKYIKREKVGGKWVYTYDSPKKYPETTFDTNDVFSKRQKVTDFKGQQHVINQRGRLEQYSDNVKRDWNESKQRVADVAKYSGGKLRDTDKWGSSKTTIGFGSGTSKVEWRNRGKRERFIDTAREYVKDRVGFDEKEKLIDAKRQLNFATINRNSAIREEVESQPSRDLGKAVGDRVKTNQAREKAVINNRDYSHAAEELPFGPRKLTLPLGLS